jgi:hypothetical protein
MHVTSNQKNLHVDVRERAKPRRSRGVESFQLKAFSKEQARCEASDPEN